MSGSEDEHIIEAIGRSRIVIREGRVVEVGEPLIRECPLARRFGKAVDRIHPSSVRENIEYRIRSFGMCTPDRIVEMDGDFVGFGASELISAGLAAGLLDSAVIACDGAGTVIVTTPSMVQGIGGRMSGLVSTSPLPPVIARIEELGGTVLDPSSARIDQAEGTARAYHEGYSKVAVTVASASDAARIRADCPDALIIAVHTTGTSAADAEIYAGCADLVTSCASRHIRDVAGKKALLQAGSAIPVFAMTIRGKELLLEKIRVSDAPMVVMGASLPYYGDRAPEPLV